MAPLPLDGNGNEDLSTGTEDPFKHYEASVLLPLDSFTPTFRGRTVPRDSPQWKKLDLSQVYELGIMCRSEFGKQSGDFELVLEKIELVNIGDHRTRNSLWKHCKTRLGDAVAAVGHLEAVMWASLTGLFCCNGNLTRWKGDALVAQ